MKKEKSWWLISVIYWEWDAPDGVIRATTIFGDESDVVAEVAIIVEDDVQNLSSIEQLSPGGEKLDRSDLIASVRSLIRRRKVR